MTSNTLYVSIDVEADGPIPGAYSMLSIGASAFLHLPHTKKGWVHVGSFKRNLLPLENAKQHEDTMLWWKTQPEAWISATENAIAPSIAMPDFVNWLAKIKEETGAKSIVVCGFPVTYDFMFVYWYTVNFAGYPAPFGFQGLDIKTLAWTKLKGEFKSATKKNMPKSWFANTPKHTHDALEDSIGQGILLMNILNDV